MNSYFALLAQFGTAEIPLSKVASEFFGLDENEAKRRAARQRLPIPAHRLNGQKSPWLVNAADLAQYIDDERAKAAEAWQRSKAA